MRTTAVGIMIMLIAVVGAVPPVAADTEPVMLAGYLSDETEWLVCEPVTRGQNTFVQVENVWTWNGELHGVIYSHLDVIIRANGYWTVHEWSTLEAQWGDLSGTIVLRVNGQGDGATFLLHFEIESGTGDFENLRGYGTFVEEGTGTVPYVAWVWFELPWIIAALRRMLFPASGTQAMSVLGDLSSQLPAATDPGATGTPEDLGVLFEPSDKPGIWCMTSMWISR